MVQQQQKAQLRFGGDQSQHHHIGAAAAAGGAAEAASPISSFPPAVAHLSTTSGTGTAAAGIFEQVLIMPAVTSADEDLFGGGGDEADRGGSGGNRWPRQETLALLKIRSEMDVAFRDATLKAPLWDDVSRKLAESGYKRSAKKCKEKFENVHKYYKRTKEGRAGRQDGKSYRFFTQLEALHGTPTSTTSTSSHPTTTAVTIDPTSLQVVSPVPVSVGFGLANQLNIPHISSAVSIHILPQSQAQSPPAGGALIPSYSIAPAALVSAPAPPPFLSAGTIGVSFSSESTSTSSYSSGSEEVEDDDVMELEGNLDEREPAGNDAAERHPHKRKRTSSSRHQPRHQPHTRGSGNTSRERMMEFFEGLMKQVMQKQEAMQQRFLEAIEKREQDRMIREEAWKRQEMARLAREHELLSQERAVSASRDAAIVAFLQKITGQTILPPAATIPAAPPPPPPAVVAVHQPPSSPPQLPPPSSQQLQQPQQPEKNYFPQMQRHTRLSQLEQLSHQPPRKSPQSAETIANNQPFVPLSPISEIVIAVPNQQVPAAEEINSTNVTGKFEATTSRWPKAEVLDLIKLRSDLELRYQEAGPKGPLWEEISAGMHQMGYKRSSKRCKEKWENINKYFEKVKESNKKRPEDAKTCPYFHELDALYQKKILGTGSTTTIVVNQIMRAEDLQIQQQQQVKNISMSMDPKTQEQSHVPAAMPSLQTKIASQSEIKDGSTSDLRIRNGGLSASLFGEGSDDTGADGGAKKPEGSVKEQQPQNHHRQLMMNDYGDTEEPDSDTLEQEEDGYNDDNEDLDDDESGEEMKMAYMIQFQRPNTGSSNEGGSGAPSFLAIIQ